MRVPLPWTFPAALLVAVALGGPSTARADDSPGTILNRIGYDQNLDAQLPLDLPFRDESGKLVKLGDYFGSKPVILNLVYFRCPMLCGEELKGLARGLRPLKMNVGDDFDIVTVSIDPTDTPELALEKKRVVLERYGRPDAGRGWHFLTGDEASIRRLAETVGFRYTYDERDKIYNHAAGLTMATAQGRISRYFYGIEFSPKDIQFGLIESSSGKIGSPIARMLLFCYHYDPATGKYTLAIVGLLRTIGSATAIFLAGYVILMLRREHLRASDPRRLPAPTLTPP